MDKKNNVFSEEYAIESSTDAPSEPVEEKKEGKTVGSATAYYGKSKPYRVIIRAKEIR